MQHFYAYTQKPKKDHSSYRTLFLLFAKLIAIMLIAALVMFTMVSRSSAQSGHLDPSFNSADNGILFKEGADKSVTALAVQSDGKIIIGGNFSSFNGTAINRIARINSNGSPDVGFSVGSGVDSTVNKIIVQPDGKIILAGAFVSYNGVTVNHIVRLNTDGSRDAGFNMGTGTNNVINKIALQADGKIIAAGIFTTYNAISSNYLVRINADGSRDGTFAPAVLNSVNDIAIQGDGKIVVGINDDQNGLVTKFLVRLSPTGANDATFNDGGTGANGSVKAIKIQPDGNILFGGDFTLYNNLNTNFTRITVDGIIDPTFDNTSGGFYNGTKVIALQPDGKVLVGFGAYNDSYLFPDVEGRKFTRLNADGTVDAGFLSDFLPQLNENVYDILVLPDDSFIVAETLVSKWLGSSARYIIHAAGLVYPYTRDFKLARYNSNGITNPDFCVNPAITGANKLVASIVTQPDNKILVGGGFFSYNGVVANYFTRLNSDGSKDATFNTGGFGFNEKVNAIALQADGKIVVAGAFSTYNGADALHLLRLNSDGSRDVSFTPVAGTENQLNSLAIQPDGKIIIGGEGRLFRLNSNGSLDNTYTEPGILGYPYNGSFFPTIYTLSLQADGKVIAGGDFAKIGSVANPRHYNLSRTLSDGSIDASYAPYDPNGINFSGVDGLVYTSKILTDGKLLIGGAFTVYTSNSIPTTVNHIARVNTDGTLDLSFNTGGSGANGDINTIFRQSDGKILIGGNFSSYNGISVNNIALLNADGTLASEFNSDGAGSNGPLATIASQFSGSKILIGGLFASYNGTTRHNIARLFNSDAGAPVSPVTTNAVICASEAPYSWNGNIYSTSGTYTAAVDHSGTITIDTLKLTVGVGGIAGPAFACEFMNAGTDAVYNISAPAGSAITWSVSQPTKMQIVAGQGTSQATIHFLSAFTGGNVYAHVVNASCGINVKPLLGVRITIPAKPGAITASSSSVCPFLVSGDHIVYSIRPVSGATSYVWAGQAGTTLITHPNGPGANDTLVWISFSPGFTSSSITVQAKSDCGISDARSFAISRNPPSKPGYISGPIDVCSYSASADVQYQVTEIAGVNYDWIMPAGAILSTFNNASHSNISIRFDAGFTSGTISVIARTGCGNSDARTLMLKKQVVGTPGSITIVNTSNCPNRSYSYTLSAMPLHATSVLWTAPVGGTIVSGQGTTSITVNYTSGVISGFVSVQGINNCSSSLIGKKNVNLAACSSPLARNDNDAAAKSITPGLNPDLMEVKVFPNPSPGDFSVQVISSGKEAMYANVFDMQGRLLKEINIKPFQTINMGAELKPGAYILEIRQGKNIKTTKLVRF